MKNTQTFNSGVVKIYDVTSISAGGDMPSTKLTLKHAMRYKERTVGLQRFWTMRQANVQVSYVLRCQRIRDVSAQDVAIPSDGKQYRIVQVQYPEDVDPPVMDLTLEELKPLYDISGR